MKVLHEPPHKELAFFARAPLTLRVAGGPDVTVDAWNTTGLCKPEGISIFPTRGTLSIPFQGIDLGFPVRLTPDASGTFYAFDGLTVRQREVLALFQSNLLSGRMASTDEMITALDTPVDLVPMSETAEEQAVATQTATPRSLRVAKALITYVAAALLIFGLAGNSIAARVLSIPAVQARVVAPLTDHLTTAPAYVDRVLVAPGDRVAQGDTLVRMSDPRREGRLEDARRAVKDRQGALSASRALLRKHEATGPAVLQDLEARLELALSRQTQPSTPDTQIAIDAAWAAISAFEAGHSLRDGDYHDIRAELLAQRSARKEDLRRAKRAAGIAKADARLLDIKAQFDGTVRAVTATEDLHVPRGASMALVEEHAPRTVRAWVDEAHLTRLAPGMAAQLRLAGPNGPQTRDGRVISVAAGIDETAAKRGFGLIVTISVPDDTTLIPDTPVKVRIWRDWTPEWMR